MVLLVITEFWVMNELEMILDICWNYIDVSVVGEAICRFTSITVPT